MNNKDSWIITIHEQHSLTIHPQVAKMYQDLLIAFYASENTVWQKKRKNLKWSTKIYILHRLSLKDKIFLILWFTHKSYL